MKKEDIDCIRDLLEDLFEEEMIGLTEDEKQGMSNSEVENIKSKIKDEFEAVVEGW